MGKQVVVSKMDGGDDSGSQVGVKSHPSNKDQTSMAELKSRESNESPSNVRRGIQDPKFSDPHAQSRFSSQSFRTGISRIASSKNLNQYGFGNSFYQKYQAQLKDKKKSPKVVTRYLQVQINDMCSKLVETMQNGEMVRNDLYQTKDKLLE